MNEWNGKRNTDGDDLAALLGFFLVIVFIVWMVFA